MKRFRIVLFGVLCMILSFAFAHSSEIHLENVKVGKEVKIAWDETTKLTNGNDISSKYPKEEGYVLRYVLYVTANKDEIKDLPKPESISENNATIIFANTGQYYIGVQASIYKKNNLKGEPVTESTISWSDIGICTNNKPFCVKVEN